MAADQRLKNLRGSGRRDFLRWGTAVAAALGVERARFLNVLNDNAGSALADTASGSTTMKSVHLIGDNGGLAWFTQLFPYPTVAAAMPSGAALYAKAYTAAATDNPAYYAPDSPFQKLAKGKQMSVFVCGSNETHTKTPNTALALGTSNLLAVASAIQTASPSLLPVMAINPFSFGTAAGAQTPATVANAAGLVGLFNSAASETILKMPANGALAESYFKAFLDLNAAAPRSAIQPAYATGRVATNLLTKNLASQLAMTTADQTRYGFTASTPTTVTEIGTAMCTAVKAFALGLTNCLIIPAMQDDPHQAFTSPTTLESNVKTLGTIFDAFMADAMGLPDPAGGSDTLGDNVVITVSGDTPKNILTSSGWPDGTASNHNLLMVMGNGYLKTGWYGSLSTAGKLTTWDPNTGAAGTMTSAQLSTYATSAAAYAIAKGDARRVSDFNGTVPAGIAIPQTS